ncbi:flagellar basal body-associated FliL family protein [Pseudoroseomonas sp. WGS1072]|uniref:flagellar basal body-associated FliL family protein n=1 Tax=Roseomonas sp. WGS1072 TaxID=3366816 RepID=UPI003BF2C161
MSASAAENDAKKSDKPPRPASGGKRRGRLLLVPLLLLPVLGGGLSGAWFLMPGAAETMRNMVVGSAAAPAAPPTARPAFLEFPEMTLTLPNAGRPRQLRLKLAVELAGDPAELQPELLSPRVYDGLVLYLRTLRDGETEGALAMDRLRGDLHRRLELMLGAGRVRDVLITGFVVA